MIFNDRNSKEQTDEMNWINDHSTSRLYTLHLQNIVVYPIVQTSVWFRVSYVLRQHVLRLHLYPLQLVALLKLLLVCQRLYYAVHTLERVLQLGEVGFNKWAVRQGSSALSDRPDLHSVGLPVVVLEVVDELVPLLVVHFDGVEILGHVAWDQVEVVCVRVESLYQFKST